VKRVARASLAPWFTRLGEDNNNEFLSVIILACPGFGPLLKGVILKLTLQLCEIFRAEIIVIVEIIVGNGDALFPI
jgi:hypothetical protein